MKLGKFYHLARCGKCCKRDELNLGGDQVEDSLALEHVEVCLHLLKVGEALVLQEGVDSNQHLLEDLPRFAQPRVGGNRSTFQFYQNLDNKSDLER